MKKKQKTTSSSTRKKTKLFSPAILLFFLVLLDQVSKYYIKKLIPLGGSFEIINGIASFTHVTNTGVSFGMFKGFNFFFIVISIIALIFFLSLYKKNGKFYLQITFIAAGIIGNLIDRISYGSVIDFIEISIFPIFNIADSLITIGVIWLIYESLINKKDLI